MKKQMKKSRRVVPAYPNAASHEYLVQRGMNIAIGIASGFGLLASLLFLAALS